MIEKNDYKKNYMYSLLYSVLSIILPIITAPYISRVIGAKGLGVYSYNYAIVTYFMNFSLLGINFYGNRAIAKIRTNYLERCIVFSEIYSMQLITSLIVLIFYIIYFVIFVENNKEIVFIMIFQVIAPVISVNWFFNGMEMFKITITRNIIIKLITVMLTFIFVKNKSDLWKYTLIISLGLFFSEGYLIFLIHKYIKFNKPKIKNVLKHFKQNIILFIPILAVSIYRLMDKLMLKWFINYEQVGYYVNAEKIINICLVFVVALGQVMLPKMTNLISKGEKEEFYKLLSKSFKFINFITIAMIFGLFGVSDLFVPIFFGKGYDECIVLIKLLSLNLILLAWGNILKTQYLIPKEKDMLYIRSVIMGAILNFILNIILIPKFASRGAVISTIFAELISLLIIIFFLRKELKILKNIFNIIPYIIIGFIMYFIIDVLKETSFTILFKFIIQVVIGIVVYGGLCVVYWIVTKDEMSIILKKYLKLTKKI